jgi:hypothetical protein
LAAMVSFLPLQRFYSLDLQIDIHQFVAKGQLGGISIEINIFIS